MKPISELKLETIQLEDQVLLVDKKSKLLKGDWHIEKELIINQFPNYLTDLSECDKIIASTKPLEGLPLLVIEDEAESVYYKSYSKAGFEDYDDFPAFKDGYNKAKETYKFTEEDLRNDIQYGRSIGYQYASQETYLDSQELKELEAEQNEDVEKYIQSLTKKELWIEVKEKSNSDIEKELGIYGHDEGLSEKEYSNYLKTNSVFKLKIFSNQIKGTWK